MNEANQEYAGFWIRVGAALIDTLIVLVITWPILGMIYSEAYWLDSSWVKGGWDFLFSYLLPAVAVILFWVYKSATPGKLATRLRIVDARTGGKPSNSQFVIRYLGYYVSVLPLFLGIIWVGIDERKQGWHDKIAGTVVLKNNLKHPVRFENQI